MDMVKFEHAESKVLEIRGVKFILDSDLAELYGVETNRINEAVKNNPDRFPLDYITELTQEEKMNWSKISTGSNVSSTHQ